MLDSYFFPLNHYLKICLDFAWGSIHLPRPDFKCYNRCVNRHVRETPVKLSCIYAPQAVKAVSLENSAAYLTNTLLPVCGLWFRFLCFQREATGMRLVRGLVLRSGPTSEAWQSHPRVRSTPHTSRMKSFVMSSLA